MEIGESNKETEMHTYLANINWPVLAKMGGLERAVLGNKIESLIIENLELARALRIT